MREVFECQITGAYVYADDAIETKEGYISPLGKYVIFKQRYEELQAKSKEYFLWYMLPFLFMFSFFVVALIFSLIMDGLPSGDIILTICFLADLIICFLRARKSLKDGSMLYDIGDPEATLYEGTLYESGSFTISSRAVYSTDQKAKMVSNILWTIIGTAFFMLFNWLYWIIYMARKGSLKRKIDNFEKENIYEHPYKITSMMICNPCEDAIEYIPDYKVTLISEGKRVKKHYSFLGVMVFKGKIIGVFTLPEKPDFLLFVEVLPGYKNKVIIDETLWDAVYQEYQKHQSND